MVMQSSVSNSGTFSDLYAETHSKFEASIHTFQGVTQNMAALSVRVKQTLNNAQAENLNKCHPREFHEIAQDIQSQKKELIGQKENLKFVMDEVKATIQILDTPSISPSSTKYLNQLEVGLGNHVAALEKQKEEQLERLKIDFNKLVNEHKLMTSEIQILAKNYQELENFMESTEHFKDKLQSTIGSATTSVMDEVAPYLDRASDEGYAPSAEDELPSYEQSENEYGNPGDTIRAQQRAQAAINQVFAESKRAREEATVPSAPPKPTLELNQALNQLAVMEERLKDLEKEETAINQEINQTPLAIEDALRLALTDKEDLSLALKPTSDDSPLRAPKQSSSLLALTNGDDTTKNLALPTSATPLAITAGTAVAPLAIQGKKPLLAITNGDEEDAALKELFASLDAPVIHQKMPTPLAIKGPVQHLAIEEQQTDQTPLAIEGAPRLLAITDGSEYKESQEAAQEPTAQSLVAEKTHHVAASSNLETTVAPVDVKEQKLPAKSKTSSKKKTPKTTGVSTKRAKRSKNKASSKASSIAHEEATQEAPRRSGRNRKAPSRYGFESK